MSGGGLPSNLPNHPVYAEILKGQSGVIQETRGHIQSILSELEDKKEACYAERVLLNTFKKDVTESFSECRSKVKDTFSAMIAHLKQKQDEMLRQLDETAQSNLDVVGNRSLQVEKTLNKLELQIEEGQNLLREQDTFAVFARGSLYRQLPPISLPPTQLRFRDEFPDMGSVSIAEFLEPLHHTVTVEMDRFLQSGEQSLICGNLFHNGFRFQIQLKHDDRYLSAYLCLRAWHDVSAFLRVSIDFTLSAAVNGAVIHSATAKNTFEGPNDGWGWNKYLPLAKLLNCGLVLFHVNFNELSYEFVGERGQYRGPANAGPGEATDATPPGLKMEGLSLK